MIVLDTHIWIWWTLEPNRLTDSQSEAIEEADEIGISVFSFWELAKLVQGNRISLPVGLSEWLRRTVGHPNVRIMELTPAILEDSIALPGTFHRDPADQIIVASARVHNCGLMTVDEKIIDYPHVRVVS